MADSQTTPRPEDGQLIWHALGLDHSIRPFRKYYISPASGPTREQCERMEANGWLEKFGKPDKHGMVCFYVTKAGAALIGVELP